MPTEKPTCEQIVRARKWAEKRIEEMDASPDGTEFLVLHGDTDALSVLCAATAPPLPDPRPTDIAELARQVAVELRKRGIWAGAAEGTKGVVVLGNPADWTPWRNSYYYDMACKAEWSSLGPVRLADAIASLEAVRAQEWAGDK